MNIMGIKNVTNIPLNQPIEPIIECDGGYAVCSKCHCEVTPHNDTCPKCRQLQDWSWLGKYKNK